MEWGIGEVAGTLAAYCMDNGFSPQQVAGRTDLVEELQRRLVAEGVELHWPDVRGY